MTQNLRSQLSYKVVRPAKRSWSSSNWMMAQATGNSPTPSLLASSATPERWQGVWVRRRLPSEAKSSPSSRCVLQLDVILCNSQWFAHLSVFQVVNYSHLFPTRYALELEGLKGSVTAETFKEPSQRENAKKTIKKLFEERYTSGKNKWFFQALRVRSLIFTAKSPFWPVPQF